MKYPACILKGKNSKGTTISIAFAGSGQFQDTGAKMIHLGEGSTSSIVSRSICRGGGTVNYRGEVSHGAHAKGARSSVECDTIILDDISKSDTIPVNKAMNNDVFIQHEATVSKVDEEQLFYLMSRVGAGNCTAEDKHKIDRQSKKGYKGSKKIYKDQGQEVFKGERRRLVKNSGEQVHQQ